MSRRKKYDNPKRRKMMIQLQDLHDSSDDLSSEDSLVEFGNAKLSTSAKDGDQPIIFRPIRTSSPIPFDESESSEASVDIDDSFESSSDELYSGGNISVSAFKSEIASLQSRHRLSDATVKDFLSFIASILPLPNRCPSYHHFKIATKPCNEPVAIEVSTGVCYILPFANMLQNIVSRNPNITVKPPQSSSLVDIIGGERLPCLEDRTLYFAINTDGISPINSRDLHVWPVILSLINLETKIRREMCNLVMVSLFVGPSKPQWSEILPHIITQLEAGVDIEGEHYDCKVICLIADMPAKSSIINIQSHNAKFGCPICLVEGTYNQTYRKVVFPCLEHNPPRSSSTHRRDVMAAEQTGVPSNGVKGYSHMSKILCIPEDIPFDPMHLIYLGVNKSFLSAILKYKLVDVEKLSTLVDGVKVPHYFRRQPRRLNTELKLWKAQEHRMFVLYYAPCIFLSCLDSSYEHSETVFILYLILSSGIYLMYKEEIKDQDIQDAGICITAFQSGLIELFGESVKTLTLHSLKHLPDQVRKYGPLHSVSAMPFENLNRQLKKSVTGTRGSAAQMVYRYLTAQSSKSPRTPCPTVTILGKFLPCKRFMVNNNVFHTADHAKNLKSSSCYAFLSDRRLFVKIKAIDLNYDDSFSVTCRSYAADPIVARIARLTYFTPDVRNVLLRNSPFFRLRKSDIIKVPPAEFQHHSIVFRHSCSMYGVKIVNSYEHE